MDRLLSLINRGDVALSALIALPETPGSPPTPARRAAFVGAHLGDSWIWLIIGWLLWRRVDQQPPAQQTTAARRFRGWVSSLILTYGLVMAIKQAVRRPRPGTGRFMYGSGPDVHSFPSGHGARMGANAPWAFLLLGGWGWLTWPLTLWVGWSRVAMGVHYLGDVLAGFLVGGLVSLAVRRLLGISSTD